MLVFGSRLLGTPIMGLQTGQELARTAAPVIDPRSLTIVAYEVEGPNLNVQPSLLRVADMREFSDIGMIVDSSDEFIALDDVIKIKEVYDFHFQLIGMQVKDEKDRKLGKVTDYSVEISDFVIQQLLVRRPLMRSLSDSELTIHRSQIVEITDTYIVVRSGELKAPEPVKEAVRHFTNPFRQEAPAPETHPAGTSQS